MIDINITAAIECRMCRVLDRLILRLMDGEVEGRDIERIRYFNKASKPRDEDAIADPGRFGL